jgi:hypothetical protein
MSRFLLSFALALCLTTLATSADPIAGRWSGYWISDSNGHRGPLRATVRPDGEGYDVRFTGRFAGVIPFVYRSHFDAISSGESVRLSASRQLPLFGTFQTTATATPTQFQADFRSNRDHGRFVLTR